MNYIVTGGACFIGGHLVDYLIDNGATKIIVIDNESADGTEEFYKVDSDIVEYHRVDVCNYDSIFPLFKNIDYVFHLAAESRIGPCIEDPVMACKTNVIGTCNVLQASRLCNVSKVIYSSTSACYGLNNAIPMKETMPMDNLNPYSTSKLAGEDLCLMYSKLYGLETVCLRYFNVFGERMPESGQYAPVIAIFQRQIREGKGLTVVGDGLQERDFVYVKDVVKANFMCSNTPCSGEVFNVGSGTNISVLEIAKLMNHHYKHIPARSGEAKTTLADISKIRNSIGWGPSVYVEDWIKQ